MDEKDRKAEAAIDDLKKNCPGYYERLYEPCKTCRNIFSDCDCEFCEPEKGEFAGYEKIGG